MRKKRVESRKENLKKLWAEGSNDYKKRTKARPLGLMGWLSKALAVQM